MNHGTALLSAASQADPVKLAVAGFLARYGEPTRTGYATDLKAWFAWCEQAGLHVLEVRRPHLEVFARQLEESGRYMRSTIKKRLATICGFYKFAHLDGFIAADPAIHVRRPKTEGESTTNSLDRLELGHFLALAAASSPMDHALACLLGLLGLRVSEACNIDINDLGVVRGHRTVTIIGKGHKRATIPMPPRVFRAIDAAIDGRTEGPVLLTRAGTRMDRFAATRIVKRLAKAAGVEKRISPHSLRHSAITACLDAGVTLRDTQYFARHADPRTTTHYDRHRHNMDRHASYVLTAFVAGGA
jgi:integrase/recombinase XerD